MKVLGLALDLVWEDVPGNIAAIEALLPEIRSRRPDLVVLPEMWSTGFTMNPGAIPEAHLQTAIDAMHRWADETDAAWYGSLVHKMGNGPFKNRGHFVRPQQQAPIAYDKRHLFTFGSEPDHYSPGGEQVIVAWRGWRILLQICYDLRFPVFSRNRRGDGSWDLALYVANWPAVRSDAWATLLKARAIENCGWVCGVNRRGVDGNGFAYDGHSGIYGPIGESTLRQVDDVLVERTLDIEELQRYRSKFPALQDADDFAADWTESHLQPQNRRRR